MAERKSIYLQRSTTPLPPPPNASVAWGTWEAPSCISGREVRPLVLTLWIHAILIIFMILVCLGYKTKLKFHSFFFSPHNYFKSEKHFQLPFPPRHFQSQVLKLVYKVRGFMTLSHTYFHLSCWSSSWWSFPVPLPHPSVIFPVYSSHFCINVTVIPPLFRYLSSHHPLSTSWPLYACACA